VAHQKKIEGRTTFENNVLGEGINNFCKRSEDDEVKSQEILLPVALIARYFVIILIIE